MAYRRRQGLQRESTFKEEGAATPPPPLFDSSSSSSSSSASSLAAKAIKASSAYRDPSLCSAYGNSGLYSSRDSYAATSSTISSSKDQTTYEYTSMKSLNEPKQGFWGVLARKAKAILDDDIANQPNKMPGRTRQQMFESETPGQYPNSYNSSESHCKLESPTLQKGLDAIASSFNHIGGTIGNVFGEGRTIVENRTADIIQETRKLQIRKKFSSELQSQAPKVNNTWKPLPKQTHVQPAMQTDLETQLEASRDVAMAMAAKAKLLLRELKTVKADLAFAKERCAQLEEENRILRESHEKGDDPEDDDLIRLQLETLLAEKARLAQENSVLARENRFLREIVEYHQLTMQDVVYLDEGTEEVTEVYPIGVPLNANVQPITSSPAVHPSSLASAVPNSINSHEDGLHSESSLKSGGK